MLYDSSRRRIVYNGRKPILSFHSSASLAAQMSNRSSMARPMSRSWGTMISPGLERLSRNPRKVCRHGLAIVRDQNPPEIGRFVEDVGIWYTDNPRRVGIPENNGPLTAAQPKNDLLVEVFVSLKPRPHALGLCAPCRAASSLE